MLNESPVARSRLFAEPSVGVAAVPSWIPAVAGVRPGYNKP